MVVATHRPFSPRFGERRHEGALAPLLDDLGAEGARHVYLDGGMLIRTGLREGLVDDMTVSIVPVTIGGGRPLFGDGGPDRKWMLTNVRSWSNGLVQVQYRRA